MTDADAERLEQLETKIAYLEQANQELSDAVFAQQKAMDRLQERLGRLADRIEALAEPSGEYSAEDDKPPHY